MEFQKEFVMICFDCNTLNQILDDSKNRKVYAKVDSHFNLVGPALIEVLNDELKLYGIVYYENGKINGDSYIFSASQDFEPLLVHFNNNTIDIIYEYVIGKNHVYDEASGRRWEGDVCIQKDGKQVFFPFGEGCEYDEANAMGFVGFRFGTERNGFGTSYWNSVKSSEGFFINGNNYGTCSLYDRKGSYLYTVMMIDGDVYMQAGDCDFERMDCSMTTLMHTFSDKFTSLPSPLLFHSFSLLREVIIPSALQSSCTFVSFTYLPLLQKIQLGNACFSQESIVIPPYTPGMAQTIRQQGKQLVIADCPCLSSITMGPFACSDFCYLTVQSRFFIEVIDPIFLS